MSRARERARTRERDRTRERVKTRTRKRTRGRVIAKVRVSVRVRARKRVRVGARPREKPDLVSTGQGEGGLRMMEGGQEGEGSVRSKTAKATELWRAEGEVEGGEWAGGVRISG